MSNDWLNDQLAEFQKQDNDKARQDERLRLIQTHTGRMFQALLSFAQDAVQRINANSEFTKRIGKLEGEFPYTDRFKVTKATYPAIYLTVASAPNSLDIEWLFVTNGANRQSSTHPESLEVDLDNDGHPFLRNKAGEAMLVEDAVQYLFQPFFKPELLAQLRSKGGTGGWSVRPLGT